MSAEAPSRASRRDARAAVAALGFLLAVTAAWWALALWPTAGEPPAWLARARWVCFNAGRSGLPDASGWLLLIGQPLGLALVLVAGFGRSLRAGLGELWSSRPGRAGLVAVALCVAVGIAAAAERVRGATRFDAAAGGSLAQERLPDTYPRLDRPAPELGLVDQRGAVLDLARLRGRPALVTFAFGHCQTVCPLLVRDVREAQQRLREGGADRARIPRIAVVTLDPWRDTPSRLPTLAESWGLHADADGFALSGPPSDVNALLDRWNVPRGRDETTGQIDHPALVYVLDPQGRIAYAATGGADALADLVGRL